MVEEKGSKPVAVVAPYDEVVDEEVLGLTIFIILRWLRRRVKDRSGEHQGCQGFQGQGEKSLTQVNNNLLSYKILLAQHVSMQCVNTKHVC